jgi:hypothetical protein
MSAQDRAWIATGQPIGPPPKTSVRMPVGALLNAAAAAAFQREFFLATAAGEAASREPGPVGASLRVATGATVPVLRVSIEQPAFSISDEFVYFIPLGPLTMSRTDQWLRLAFDVRVLDTGGRPLWSRRYDSGRVDILPARSGERLWMVDRAVEPNVTRVAHEQAARLMQQAARDLHGWFVAEWHRERVL